MAKWEARPVDAAGGPHGHRKPARVQVVPHPRVDGAVRRPEERGPLPGDALQRVGGGVDLARQLGGVAGLPDGCGEITAGAGEIRNRARRARENYAFPAARRAGRVRNALQPSQGMRRGGKAGKGNYAFAAARRAGKGGIRRFRPRMARGAEGGETASPVGGCRRMPDGRGSGARLRPRPSSAVGGQRPRPAQEAAEKHAMIA